MKMASDMPLDYALFQLSPKRSRCDLFVSSVGNTEKLASGLVKPFVTHLKVAEEQFAQAAQSIKLEVDNRRNAETWFTKGTLERFVRFVSTPEVVELVNAFDAEMSQLEAARKIYSQGPGDQHSGSLGANGTGAIAAADATKKELVKAIDVRLVALKQDLTSACARAAAAGFHSESVPELQKFADHFGGHRLNDACGKFLMLCQRRPELRDSWTPGPNMSVDESPTNPCGSHRTQPPKPDESEPSEEAAANELSQTSQPPVRRLSVQDRINMFESKQKESSSTPKPVVLGKAELRRLSSEATLSAAPRRWSAASDSVDLESPSNSSTVSGVSNDKDRNVGTEMEISQRGEVRDRNDSQTGVGDSSSQGGTRLRAFPGRAEDVDFVKQASSQNQFEAEHLTFDSSSTDKVMSSPEKMKASFGDQEHGRVKDQVSSEKQDSVMLKNLAAPRQAPSSVYWDNVEEVRKRDQQFTAQSGSIPVDLVTVFTDSSVSPDDAFGGATEKELLGGSLTQHKRFGSSGGEVENRMGKKDSVPSEKQAGIFAKKVEDSGLLRTRYPRQGSGTELTKKPQGRREDSNSISGNKLVFPGKMASESQETGGSMWAAPVEQVQRGRQAKGNQELNAELKMKANELEKLFAEHKLRVPGDQSLSNRRSKATDVDQITTTQNAKPAEASPSRSHSGNKVTEPMGSSSNLAMFGADSASKPADYQDNGVSLKQNFSELSFSDDSRGKFYAKYMHKRDAKLKEEWRSKRVEKEAKMKSMHDNLERSKAEMKEKFEGSTDRRNSVLNAHKRAEKQRSFNFQSVSTREQQPIDSLRSEGDENSSSELLEQKFYGQSSEASFGNGASSRSFQNKKLTANRSLSSSIPRASAIPVPRVSNKSSNSGSGRRRTQSENTLAQSVPNFSDFRKENTKPSSGGSKTATRYRSKSATEEIPLVKEEKSRRSQILKKTSPSPVEFKDLPVSDGVVLSPLQFERDQTEMGLDDKLSRSMEPKHFLRKGYGIGLGSTAGVAKLKASMTPETLKDEEESAELHFEPEDCVDMVNDEDDGEEFETSMAEDSSDMNNEKLRLSEDTEEYVRLGHSESENDAAVRSASQVVPAFVTELPAAVPSTFDNVRSIQESPGASPVSWNSRMRLSFSYPHETSDIDVSADSPMGSPVSWNSHSLTQTEAEAARIRKKWGSSQKPVIVASSSQNHSRMDVTKGFKRLLKFGRKNRGAETLVDWISATTSEGDDDTEDGRDAANRSSEDLRKSRMGFSHGHPSKDGFNELFNEHALGSSIPAPPASFKLREDHLSGSSLKASRSFFSLPTFRSKGSESKPR